MTVTKTAHNMPDRYNDLKQIPFTKANLIQFINKTINLMSYRHKIGVHIKTVRTQKWVEHNKKIPMPPSSFIIDTNTTEPRGYFLSLYINKFLSYITSTRHTPDRSNALAAVAATGASTRRRRVLVIVKLRYVSERNDRKSSGALGARAPAGRRRPLAPLCPPTTVPEQPTLYSH